ncbi:MAG: trypsin-like peptidase domain-containing protein [Candidatus Izemoplasmatales bacterium]
MKRILALFLALIATVAFAGCTFVFPISTTTRSTTAVTTAATTVSVTTTEVTIDIDLIRSEVYNRIYAELYDAVYAEVAADLSQDRFDEIYAQIMDDVVAMIVDGTITVTPLSIVELVRSVAMGEAQAVVGVANYDAQGNGVSVGSGVVYKHTGDQYYVVTNNHVVEGAASLRILTPDGEYHDGVLRGVDATVDVAVIYFTSATDYATAAFGDSDLVTKGTIVLAVGNPSGFDYYGSMTMGIVSGLDRYFDIDNDEVKDMFVNYIQHDASINAGNSGGALFNLDGEVIGINVIKIAATEIEGMGFAIPSNLVSAICDDIEEFGVSKVKPVLGITFVDIAQNPDYFTFYGITLPEGIEAGFYVLAVGDGATLDGYVEPGDIVTRIGAIDIVDTDDFVQQFKQYHVGDVISVTVYRNGGYLTFDAIELMPRP